MMRYLFAILTLGLITCSAYATCVVRQRVVVAAQDAVVVQKVIPLYTATYVGDNNNNQSILEALKAIENRIKNLEASKPQNDPFNPPTTNNGLKVITTRCASCHDDKNAAGRGGNLTLIKNGNLVNLTDRQALKVITKTYKGEMPPKSTKPGLTDTEIGQIVDYIDGFVK